MDERYHRINSQRRRCKNCEQVQRKERGDQSVPHPSRTNTVPHADLRQCIQEKVFLPHHLFSKRGCSRSLLLPLPLSRQISRLRLSLHRSHLRPCAIRQLRQCFVYHYRTHPRQRRGNNPPPRPPLKDPPEPTLGGK